MRHSFTITLLIAIAAAATTGRTNAGNIPVGAACGIERWNIKTLRDAGVRRINPTVRDTTISWLVTQPAPADPDSDVRLEPMEVTVWRVHAELLGYKLESDDSDYHLVLRDPVSHRRMIAEIPAPYCVTGNAQLYATLRSRVDALGGAPAGPRFHWLDRYGAGPIITISGVGFFDREHAQTGAASNGVELHPVLDLK